MQDTQTGQIRWSRILNRDPTPPSDFWPPLQTDCLIPPPPSGQMAGEVVTAGLSRREAYVISMYSTAAASQNDNESSSLHSLERFLESGIGVDAIRNSARISRVTSMNSSHQSLATPPQRLLDLDEEKADHGGKPVSSDEISLLEMLQASPTREQSYEATKPSNNTEIVPSNSLERLFNEKHPNDMNSKAWCALAGYFQTYPQLVKTMCAKSVSSIKKKSERLYRVAKWRQPRRRRLSGYKRKSGMGVYDGT